MRGSGITAFLRHSHRLPTPERRSGGPRRCNANAFQTSCHPVLGCHCAIGLAPGQSPHILCIDPRFRVAGFGGVQHGCLGSHDVEISFVLVAIFRLRIRVCAKAQSSPDRVSRPGTAGGPRHITNKSCGNLSLSSSTHVRPVSCQACQPKTSSRTKHIPSDLAAHPPAPLSSILPNRRGALSGPDTPPASALAYMCSASPTLIRTIAAKQ